MARGAPCLILLSLTIVLILLSGRTNSASVKTCIMNCGQCKKMYGEYFLGQMCAEECLRTGGMLMPDCNEPGTINRYLARIM